MSWLIKALPTGVTLCALATGLTAMRFCMHNKCSVSLVRSDSDNDNAFLGEAGCLCDSSSMKMRFVGRISE